MKYIKLHTAAHKSHTFKIVFFCNRLLKRRLLKINVNKIEDATHPLTSPISALFLYVSSDAVRSGHYSSGLSPMCLLTHTHTHTHILVAPMHSAHILSRTVKHSDEDVSGLDPT